MVGVEPSKHASAQYTPYSGLGLRNENSTHVDDLSLVICSQLPKKADPSSVLTVVLVVGVKVDKIHLSSGVQGVQHSS